MSLGALARAVADDAAYLSRRPLPSRVTVPPAPLERTDRAPWVWVTAQAQRSQVDPLELAAALRRHPRIAAVATRPDGLLEITVSPRFLAAAVQSLASGSGMPPAHLVVQPAGPGVDAFGLAVSRFEAARVAGGAPALSPEVALRRTLDNPVMVVLLAHARSARVAARVALPASDAPTVDGAGLTVDPSAISALTDPLDLALITELLDAPRRLARYQSHPQDVATALLAVATAYLVWEERCPPVPTRPGEATTALQLARQLVSHAGRSVLERGLAVLGVGAPARM